MKNKIRGNLMSLAGFFMISINALSYLLKGDKQFIIGTIGFLFLIIGINISKKK